MSVTNTAIPGFKVIIMGPTGTGKTTSLGTLVDAGLELFTIFTESNGPQALAGYWTDRGKPIPPTCHWHYIRPKASPLDAMIATAGQVSTYDYASLAKVTDSKRSQMNQYIDVLKAIKDFPDDRDGKTYGDVTTWGTDRVFAVDSLTGLNELVMTLVVGSKPVRAPPDWGVAQNMEAGLLHLLTTGSNCHFVLIGHVDRQQDSLDQVKLTIKAPGKALAPEIPLKFSDVILAKRAGTKWTWSTADSQADVTGRNVPIADNLEPSFAQIITKWRSRAG
jgi:hypothetical protein